MSLASRSLGMPSFSSARSKTRLRFSSFSPGLTIE